MITQNIHVRMDAYGIPPVIHAVEGDTWRYLDIYTDDAAISTSNTAAVAIHRPDNSYYTISATPDVGGFYHLEMDQALTRPGKVECQLKVSSGDLVISTYTFYVIVEPSTTGLPTEQLGYDIYDLIDAAQQIQNVGLTEEIKQALLDCFEHVAWTDEHGQDYVDALEAALYPPAELASISAVYTQSGTVYTTDTLDSLKTNLVVTAHYTDSTSETVTTYTLSGTLTEGTSVITVTYEGKTTTFNVTVTAPATLSSITAVYTQSGTVYDTDTLDSLKSDLVVTAVYSDSSTETVASTDYTLSGTLTAGTSTITVSYGGKTSTFTVTVTEYVDPRVLVKNWDLTNSLTDTVGGTVATLGAKSGVANPTQDSSGLHFNAATQYIFFGTYDTLAGKTVELDVASFSFAGNSAYHIRFFCLSSNIYTTSTVYGPLLYRSGQGWSGYFNYPSNRQWMTNWIDGTSSEVINAINGKTVKVVFGSDGSTIDLYLDDVHIGTRTGMIVNSGTYFIVGGNTEDQTKGDQCYNMTLTGVRIYENESAS